MGKRVPPASNKGRPGHSEAQPNCLDAAHNVDFSFCQKDKNLKRLNYVVRTNMGLLQSNQTRMITRQGTGYHWSLEIFERLKLSVTSQMKEAVLLIRGWRAHAMVHTYGSDDSGSSDEKADNTPAGLHWLQK